MVETALASPMSQGKPEKVRLARELRGLVESFSAAPDERDLPA
jgi:hypothetical protein